MSAKVRRVLRVVSPLLVATLVGLVYITIAVLSDSLIAVVTIGNLILLAAAAMMLYRAKIESNRAATRYRAQVLGGREETTREQLKSIQDMIHGITPPPSAEVCTTNFGPEKPTDPGRERLLDPADAIPTIFNSDRIGFAFPQRLSREAAVLISAAPIVRKDLRSIGPLRSRPSLAGLVILTDAIGCRDLEFGTSIPELSSEVREIRKDGVVVLHHPEGGAVEREDALRISSRLGLGGVVRLYEGTWQLVRVQF